MDSVDNTLQTTTLIKHYFSYLGVSKTLQNEREINAPFRLSGCCGAFEKSKLLVLIISFFCICVIVFIYFIIKPTLNYKLSVGQNEFTLTRQFPINKRITIQPKEIKEITIELMMDKPYAATIKKSFSIRIQNLTQANYASLRGFTMKFDIRCITEEIYHGG